MDAIEIARDILGSAPEINPSSYDHDQVCQLNAAANEAYDILDKALAANQLPPDHPVAEELSSEPVAWMDQEGCPHTTEESAYFRGRPVTPLYTHPQPAVPEEFDIRRNSNGDIIVTRLSDMGAAAYSKGSPIVTEVMGWLFIDALLTATPVKPAAPDVDALAEFIRDMDDGEYIPYHEFAQKICNWIEEQKNDQ